jgi:phage terminase small subunit
MSDAEKHEELKPEWKKFAWEYVETGKKAKSYMKIYPDSSYDSARGSASDLLANPNIRDYINEIQKDLAIESGISRFRVLKEQEKIGFSNIADIHETWEQKKPFQDLTDSQKAAISEIKVKTNSFTDDTGMNVEVEEITVKLHDKGKALDTINKMLGYNEAEKHEITERYTIIRSGKEKEEL